MILEMQGSTIAGGMFCEEDHMLRIGPLPVVAGGGGCNHGERRQDGEKEFHGS
jgi:hypothetical protein